MASSKKMTTKKGEVRYSTGLTAAALQDHLSRQLSLSVPKTLCSTCYSNTRRRKKRRENSDQEIVLDSTPPPLSLAEKLGLMPGPEPQLTCGQWEQVKTTSRVRQDSTQPCPICYDEFGTKQQVLLSCSHVFHRDCLKSMEKFSGRKSCPICRHDNYQMRLIQDGRHHHRVKCAIRIQAWWRGVITRRWYHEIRRRVPPNNPTLRYEFFSHKLSSITTQLVESCEQQSTMTDSVLAAADIALQHARTTIRSFEEHQEIGMKTDWTKLKLRAIEIISSTDCSICISPLLTSSGHRPISVLSCGHVIHEMCVSSLEQYCNCEGDLFLCPLCRTPYTRQPLHF